MQSLRAIILSLFLFFPLIINSQEINKYPDFSQDTEAVYLYPTDKTYFKKGIRNKELSNTECLTYIIYAEARGEPDEGQVAVGFVVKNRADKWKKTLCQIARSPGEFDVNVTGLYGFSDRAAWHHALNIAFFLNERNGYVTLVSPVGDAIYFNSLSASEQIVMGRNRKGRFKGKIGHHYFYGEKRQ